MTFEELRKAGVSGETILVGSNNIERTFIGFTDRFIVISTVKNWCLERWSEENIEAWTIKKPERETIDLYRTINACGHFVLCSNEGSAIDFSLQRITSPDFFNTIHKEKEVFMTIYADNFEKVTKEK